MVRLSLRAWKFGLYASGSSILRCEWRKLMFRLRSDARISKRFLTINLVTPVAEWLWRFNAISEVILVFQCRYWAVIGAMFRA